jgi:3-oxoadipate enol-lactonase
VQRRLNELHMPTLVLAGELDTSTTPQIMIGIANRIPGAHYQELAATSHMQTLECPDLVADALNQFLPAQGQS